MQRLEWRLTMATSWIFREVYLHQFQSSDHRVAPLSSYLLELSLCSRINFIHRPSLLAASCLCLALFTLQRRPWTSALERISSYAVHQLDRCIADVLVVHIRACSHDYALIHNKYASEAHHQVALLAPPSKSKSKFPPSS